MTGFKPTLECPCGELDTSTVLEYRSAPEGENTFDLKGAAYDREYRRCNICGHFFSRHNMDLSDLYSEQYVDVAYDGGQRLQTRLDQILALPPEKSDNAARVANINQFFERLEPDSPSEKSVLDVGAGIGVFGKLMQEYGWTVHGIEPDPRNVEHLKKYVGIDATASDFFDLDPSSLGRFSLISFNKVLEHIENPIPMLVRAKEFLLPDGVVYVELPDVEAEAEGAGREEFFIEHHHIFSEVSITMLARNAGYSVLSLQRLREPSTKFTLRTFLKPKAEQRS